MAMLLAGHQGYVNARQNAHMTLLVIIFSDQGPAVIGSPILNYLILSRILMYIRDPQHASLSLSGQSPSNGGQY